LKADRPSEFGVAGAVDSSLYRSVVATPNMGRQIKQL
jgi:hypothetical protein